MDLIKYFQGIKGAGSLPAGLNPATWMLQVCPISQACCLRISPADCWLGLAVETISVMVLSVCMCMGA